MVDLCIVQNDDSLSLRILGQYIFKKLQEYLRIIFFVFFHVNVSRFVVQETDQFYAFMLSIGWYDPLFSLGKPCFHDGLVVADHGLVFKKDCGNVTIKEFFLIPQMSPWTEPVFRDLPYPVYMLALCS